MNNKTKNRICAILLIIAVISSLFCARWAASAENHTKQFETIDKNISWVMLFTGATEAVSIAMTAIPDDTATPVAEQLAQFTDYFVITLCILLAEKYLMTILGLVAFRFVIPIACILGIAGLKLNKNGLVQSAIKVTIIGLTLAFTIPIGIKVNEMIIETYEISFNNTIELSDAIGDETDAMSSFNLLKEAKHIINQVTEFIKGIIEGIAVVIVTSCIIPVFIFATAIWILKTLLKQIAGTIVVHKNNDLIPVATEKEDIIEVQNVMVE